MKKQNEMITKTVAAAEVLKKLYTIRLLAIMIIVFSFLSYATEFLQFGFYIVTVALIVGAYYLYRTNQEINYLRNKYAI